MLVQQTDAKAILISLPKKNLADFFQDFIVPLADGFEVLYLLQLGPLNGLQHQMRFLRRCLYWQGSLLKPGGMDLHPACYADWMTLRYNVRKHRIDAVRQAE